MKTSEFKKLLNAPPPLLLNAGWMESLVFFRGLSSLTLEKEYFIVSTPLGKRKYMWNEVLKFQTISSPVTTPHYIVSRRVFINTKSDENTHFYNQLFSSAFSYLPSNYGLTVTQLTQLMNHWRERASK